MKQINFVKDKLASGRSVLGIWSIINSPQVSEIAALAGLDFQILDMEHGIFDLSSLDNAIRACESRDCSPIVRVAGPHASGVQSCLDLGAHGIIFPQVADIQAAVEAVRTTLYAPDGPRGFNPFTRAGHYAGQIGPQTPQLKNGFGLTSVIIENRAAYGDLDRILAIPELDMVYLGIYDMSVALGCAGNMQHPSIIEFVSSSLPRIRKAGKAAGMMVTDPTQMTQYLDMGANFMVYGVDSFILRSALDNAVSLFRKR